MKYDFVSMFTAAYGLLIRVHEHGRGAKWLASRRGHQIGFIMLPNGRFPGAAIVSGMLFSATEFISHIGLRVGGNFLLDNRDRIVSAMTDVISAVPRALQGYQQFYQKPFFISEQAIRLGASFCRIERKRFAQAPKRLRKKLSSASNQGFIAIRAN